MPVPEGIADIAMVEDAMSIPLIDITIADTVALILRGLLAC